LRKRGSGLANPDWSSGGMVPAAGSEGSRERGATASASRGETPNADERAAARFWPKVQPTGFCWDWAASKNEKGYGMFWLNSKHSKAHRVAYELLVGPIPDGMELDHLCRNRACVNPDHLEPVTHAENMARSRAARKHCPHGHEYTEENSWFDKTGEKRMCRTCMKERGKAQNAQA
jgi:hypothetical protein